MSEQNRRKDLVLLVADNNIKFFLRGLLTRTESLGIRSLTCDVYVHPNKDNGCCFTAHEIIRCRHKDFVHALVVFDREGSGQDELGRKDIEARVEEQLARNGWEERAAAIVLDPELENWVWSNSPHLETVLGWQGRSPSLREWLTTQGFLERASTSKPQRPKEAVATALRMAGKSRSSSLYEQLATRVTLEGCTDPAFQKFRKIMSEWFSPL